MVVFNFSYWKKIYIYIYTYIFKIIYLFVTEKKLLLIAAMDHHTCRPFTKHRGRIQKFRATGNLKHLYKNESGKACFAHDATHSNTRDLAKRTILDKILKDRAYEIARNCNYDGY